MEPITIALGIASLVPDLLKYFGKGKDATIAEKVIEVAKVVTGKSSGEEAAAELRADPAKLLEYHEAILAQEVELAKLSATVVQAVNTTMQTEAGADHWPTYSWRPFIGFSFGLWINSVWLLPLFHIVPVMLPAEVMLAIGGILGVASWFRGKAQADPAVQTDMRG